MCAMVAQNLFLKLTNGFGQQFITENMKKDSMGIVRQVQSGLKKKNIMTSGNKLNKTPQQLGYSFENEFAKRLGASLQKGSGNQWYAKLDVKGKSFLWSLKYTSKEQFPLSRCTVHEAVKATMGPGGKSTVYPGIAVRLVDEDLIVMRASDFLEMASEDVKIVEPTKRAQKMVQGSVPTFNRGTDGAENSV